MTSYVEVIDEQTVRLERLLPGPIDRVWAYITDGEKRARWLAGGNFDISADVLEGRTPRPFWKTHTALENEYKSRL